MKYTIMGFSQKRLIELGLDLTDAMILRWIVDFSHTKSIIKIESEGELFMWISYKALGKDLPILGVKKRAIAARMQKLDDAGVLISNLIKNHQGTFSCFRLNEEVLDSLLSYQNHQDADNNRCRSNCNGGAVQTATKDPSTKGSFLNPHNPPQGESCDLEKSEVKDEGQKHIQIIIDKLNESAGTSYRASSKATQRLLKARLKEFDANTLINMCRFKAFKWRGTDMEKYLRPETLFNATKCEGYVVEMLKYVKDQQAKKKRQQPEEDDYWTRTRLEAIRGKGE